MVGTFTINFDLLALFILLYLFISESNLAGSHCTKLTTFLINKVFNLYIVLSSVFHFFSQIKLKENIQLYCRKKIIDLFCF